MYFQAVKPILILLLLLGNLYAKAQPQPVEIRPMQDYYYLGDGMGLKSGANCYVLSSRKDFKKLFGETKRPDTPDFSKELMLVLLTKKTSWNEKLSFSKVCIKAGGFIEVYCKMDEGRHQLTYQSYPIKVCIIPRMAGVNRIDFYNEWKMKPLASLPVK